MDNGENGPGDLFTWTRGDQIRCGTTYVSFLQDRPQYLGLSHIENKFSMAFYLNTHHIIPSRFFVSVQEIYFEINKERKRGKKRGREEGKEGG